MRRLASLLLVLPALGCTAPTNGLTECLPYPARDASVAFTATAALTPTRFCVEKITAEARRMADCNHGSLPRWLQLFGGPERVLRANCQQNSELVRSGALTFDSTAATRCIAAIDSAPCGPIVGGPCLSALAAAPLSAGDTCPTWGCGADLFCDDPILEPLCAPKCQPRPRDGERCSQSVRDPCEAGLTCDGTCHVLPKAGQPCLGVNVCDSRTSYCDEGSHTCMSFLPEGAHCSDDSLYGGCGPGLACDGPSGDKKCSRGLCGQHYVIDLCLPSECFWIELTCDRPDRCAEPPLIGDACDPGAPGACGPYSYCAVIGTGTGTCAPSKLYGDVCSSAPQCASSLCMNGVCQGAPPRDCH